MAISVFFGRIPIRRHVNRWAVRPTSWAVHKSVACSRRPASACLNFADSKLRPVPARAVDQYVVMANRAGDAGVIVAILVITVVRDVDSYRPDGTRIASLPFARASRT